MNDKFIPLPIREALSSDEMVNRSKAFYGLMATRRSVRDFSAEPVPSELIDECIRTAGSAPSGANQQPWHFALVTDPETKHEIRLAAEEEEREFYAGRAGAVWLDTLAPLGTNAAKPFLDEAPVLIAIFEQKYHVSDSRSKIKHYYSKESTGIATGMLITALHHAGLATLTHTPSPMNFLANILDRPSGERPFLLLVVGFPKAGALVPDIQKKDLEAIVSRH